MPKLPSGYTREPPEELKRSLTIPGQSSYSGADISMLRDGKGRRIVAFCCRPTGGDPASFGFRMFWEDTGETIPYMPFCHERGQLWKDDFTGKPMWIAW